MPISFDPQWEVDFPKEWLSPKSVRARVLNEMRGYAKWIIREYMEKTIETWEHKKDVFFEYEIRYAGGAARLTIFVTDWQNNAWNFLDEGTDVKYVIPSPDFLPKTWPNTFDSFQGRGTLRKTKHPQIGIVAREWSVDLMGVVDNGSFALLIYNMAEAEFLSVHGK